MSAQVGGLEARSETLFSRDTYLNQEKTSPNAWKIVVSGRKSVKVLRRLLCIFNFVFVFLFLRGLYCGGVGCTQ